MQPLGGRARDEMMQRHKKIMRQKMGFKTSFAAHDTEDDYHNIAAQLSANIAELDFGHMALRTAR